MSDQDVLAAFDHLSKLSDSDQLTKDEVEFLASFLRDHLVDLVMGLPQLAAVEPSFGTEEQMLMVGMGVALRRKFRRWKKQGKELYVSPF